MAVTAISQTPLVSVITVCFNAAKVLPRTIASLQAQHWQAREWVVVDGASSDGTQTLVQSAWPAAYLSEPDRGIYDAMNKAIALARGDVLFFLNADDRLHSADVLGRVAALFAADPALDLVYGNVIVERATVPTVHKSFRRINRHTLPFEALCHQAVFARRRLFDEVGVFNLRWPTSADYDWLLRVFAMGFKVQYVDIDIAYFPAGGAHAHDPAALATERRAIRLQYMTPVALACGRFISRVAHRLSRSLRGGLWIGESEVGRA